jgi:hypothetical protein
MRNKTQILSVALVLSLLPFGFARPASCQTVLDPRSIDKRVD